MSVPNLTGPKIEVYMNEPVKKPIEFHGGESKLPNGEHAITVAWSPYLGLMAGWRGVNENAAQHIFSLGPSVVEVFIGQRIVFQTLADFDEWQRQKGLKK